MTTDIYSSPSANLGAGDGAVEPLTMSQILFSFKGRIGRKAYWLAFLGMMVAIFAVIMVLSVAGVSEDTIGLITLLIYVPLIWMSLAVQIKRWHDRNKSGWWILIGLIPVIGSIWALIENGFLAGDDSQNNFGAPSN